MKKSIITAGVMTLVLGVGLTSTLVTQQDDEIPTAVVEKKVDAEFEKLIEIRSANILTGDEQHAKLIRELDEAKERELAEQRRLAEIREYKRQQALAAERARQAELKRQAELRRQEELKRQAELQRQAELAKARTQQPTKVEPAKAKATESVPTEVKNTITLRFSHYTAYCDGCSGITSTGYNVKNTVYYQGMRIIATDPAVLPAYSIIQFEFDGQMVKAIALDVGGAINGHDVDMLVGSKSEAYSRGVYSKQVQVLRYGR